MYRESAILRGDDRGATATLLFQPDSITAVTDAAGDQVYEEGADYIVERAQRRLVRTPGSRMPWIHSEASGKNGALTHATRSRSATPTLAIECPGDRRLSSPDCRALPIACAAVRRSASA
jgi:hypothetical protein